MMKRSLSLLAFIVIAANARGGDDAFVRTIAQCRGLDAEQVMERAKAAQQDPAVAYAKQHPHAAMPIAEQCTSRVWNQLHASDAPLRLAPGPLARAPFLDKERKQRGEIHTNGGPPPWSHAGGNGKANVDVIHKGGSAKVDLRLLPSGPPEKTERPEREGPEITPGVLGPGDVLPESVLPPTMTVTTQSLPGGPRVNAVPAPSPLASFDGLDFANWGAGHPPDTNGDVGPKYYIQTINTSIGIYDKATGSRVAAFTFNAFMSQGHFGNLCDTNNFGDPVVLYDTFEDRWIITDFAFKLDAAGNVVNPPGAFQCIAASINGDPVSGGWNFYSINVAGGLGDYPKFGIWPDGLYMSANVFGYPAGAAFQNSRLYAFNKAQMYAGSSNVQVVSFDLPSDQFTVLPANARLQTGTPPAGSPNYFASVWNWLNAIEIWKFHVDWDNPPLSTVTGPFDSTMGFWWAQYSRANATTAPTPANANDTLYPRLMVQNQYSNINGVESLWDSHTAGAGNPTSNVTATQSAVRFYQVAVTGGVVGANTVQSFTYSPDASVFRYMPSTAVDAAGNLAIGYTTSSATLNPGLKYAGRLAGDPVNTVSQTEQTLFQGTGAQSGNCGTSACIRWGDYSAMTLDPDGCTFWYTNEYYATNGLNHQTRIGAFSYGPSACTSQSGLTGSLAGTVTASDTGLPISGATVTFGSRIAVTGSNGAYAFTNVPVGTYATASAAFPGYNTGSAANLVITTSGGGVTIQNFSLSTAQQSACSTDGLQAGFQNSDRTNIDITTNPGHAQLARPDQIDQQNTNISSNGAAFTNTSWAGQTFTAAVTAPLIRADLFLFCASCSGANPDITVSIRATTTGTNPVPTGPDLATATIPGFNDNAAGGYYTATFASPMTMTAGTRYAIIFRLTAARAGSQAYAVSGTTNPYTAGQRVTSSNSGSTWTADTAGRDLGFRMYYNNGYQSPGTLISSVRDSNPTVAAIPTWGSLAWSTTTPAGTAVKFQAAASNSRFGPFTFVGPDGTASSFFTTSPASLSQFNGNRYLKYEAILTTSSGTITPSLDSVSLCYSDNAPPALSVAPSTATYGDSATVTATMISAGVPVAGKSVSFKLDSESATFANAVTDSNGVATATAPLNNRNAGPHNVTAKFDGDGFYPASTGFGSLTITPKSLTVNAVTDSKQYDGTKASSATPTFTPALVSTDTAAFILAFDSKDAGPRSLVATGAVNDGNGGNNYSITFVNATGSITPKAITGTITASNKVYDGTDAATIATRSLSGVIGSDDVAYAGGVANFSDKNAGTGKSVHATGLGLTGNAAGDYTVNATADATADITRRPITVTADSGETKVYGSGDPSFTYSITNGALVAGDAFSGALSRAAGENAGSYALTQGTLTAGDNYDLKFNATNFTVSPLAITVSAVADTKVYDGTTSSTGVPTSAPALIGTDKAAFTQSFDNKNAGTGKTLTAAGTVNDGNNGHNYSITFAPNTNGIIKQRDIGVTANAGQGKVFGSADPTLTCTVTSGSLVNGDGFTGALTRTAGEDAGAYPILIGSLTAGPNYNVSFTSADFSIAKASAVSINVSGYTGTYDGLPHGATGTATGVLGEDLSSLLSFGPGVKNVPGGTATWTFRGNNDYAQASGTVDIVINPATLTVTANDAARVYSYANPTFTASYSGFANGETLATSGVTGSPSFVTTATQLSGIGTYPITVAAGTLAAQNYIFTFKSGTLIVYAAGFVGLDHASFGSNKAVADSFSSTGGYPSTLGSNAFIVSNGTVEIGGARVNGNVMSSQSNVLLQPNSYITGTVSAGTSITNTKATVLGGSSQNQLVPAIVAPPVTACSAFTLNPALSGGQYTYANGDLTISGNALVTLANGTYCFHNVTISGQARLQVSGPVSINATGIVAVSGGGIVNTTHIPANLQIASSFSGASGVAIAGGADTYLTIYAPSTDVTVSGNASFFGAILGKTLTFSGNPDAHLDTALPNIWSSFFGF